VVAGAAVGAVAATGGFSAKGVPMGIYGTMMASFSDQNSELKKVPVSEPVERDVYQFSMFFFI